MREYLDYFGLIIMMNGTAGYYVANGWKSVVMLIIQMIGSIIYLFGRERA